MRKYLNITTVLMLIVYGVLVLAAVPMHDHPQMNVERSHHSSTQTSHDCGVCSFTAVSVTFQPSIHSVLFVEYAERIFFVDFKNELASVCIKEYPRRGPPVTIS